MEPAKIRHVIADNLRSERGRQRIGQQRLAEEMAALGFSWVQQTVSDVERRRRAISVEELFALALILKVPLSGLLNLEFGGTIQYGTKKSIPSAIIGPWVKGRIRIGLIWDEKKKTHTAISYEPEENFSDVLDALQALTIPKTKRGVKK